MMVMGWMDCLELAAVARGKRVGRRMGRRDGRDGIERKGLIHPPVRLCVPPKKQEAARPSAQLKKLHGSDVVCGAAAASLARALPAGLASAARFYTTGSVFRTVHPVIRQASRYRRLFASFIFIFFPFLLVYARSTGDCEASSCACAMYTYCTYVGRYCTSYLQHSAGRAGNLQRQAWLQLRVSSARGRVLYVHMQLSRTCIWPIHTSAYSTLPTHSTYATEPWLPDAASWRCCGVALQG